MKRVLYFLPRFLAVLFVLFISMFALDVFGEERWFLALIIHLIPSIILVIATTIAWRNSRLGALIFIILSLIFALFFHSALIGFPLFVIAALFLWQSLVNKS